MIQEKNYFAKKIEFVSCHKFKNTIRESSTRLGKMHFLKPLEMALVLVVVSAPRRCYGAFAKGIYLQK